MGERNPQRCRFQHHAVHNSSAVDFFNVLTGPGLLDFPDARLPVHRERLFPPTETLSMFLAQALSADGSCRWALDQSATYRLLSGLPLCSTSTGGVIGSETITLDAAIFTSSSRHKPAMARLPRFNLVDVPQHVIQRGNNRQACFFEENDYGFYLDCLRDAAANAGCDLHAYVVMTNHVHLLVTPRRDHAVPRMMQSIGRRYVRYVNHRHQRTGTLWEGRYRASLVEAERYLLACYRYIELNPVRAQDMAAHPRDYPWSSYHANAHGDRDGWLTAHPLYTNLGSSSDARRKAYRDLFSETLSIEETREIRDSIRQDIVLGGERFRDQIERTLHIRARPAKRGRPKKKQSTNS